jgi:aspartyl-tRNA(Asn)/glutamyl-tRNA(Gln) amidotransferase subunit A
VDTLNRSMRDLADGIRSHTLSSLDVVDACLARIDALGAKLNAFITVLSDQARAEARIADAEIRRGAWRGPLHGIPIGIKDFYDTAGVRTTAAFEAFKDRVPHRDAAAVAALKRAGAIVIGKTNMHRLGMGTTGLDSAFGPVVNPWNDAYIPGGSSSGSACAVATGMCCATLDTDAIGSCRLPAACCGVVGFKGTHGLLSTSGILEGEKADDAIVWLAHVGITTRSADDTALVLKTLTAGDGRVSISDARDDLRHRPLRIGVADNFEADRRIASAFDAAVAAVRTLGHHIEAAHAPFDIPRIGDVGSIENDRETIAGRAFVAIDLLLLPTTPATTPSVKEAGTNPQALSAAHTVFANYFGLPAISVPCGFDDHGLPIGFQIVGRPWDDDTVLRFARQYQAAAAPGVGRPIP